MMDSRLWSDEEALAYIASYPDLVDAFGEDAEAGRVHYTRHGRGEGRSILFDHEAYVRRASLSMPTERESAARHLIRANSSLYGQRYPLDYEAPGEAGMSYQERVRSGFLDRYCRGNLILDVGYTGYDNPSKLTAVPGAIGIDTDTPGYDGLRLPFDDSTVDTVFSSHCLEHIQFDHAAIRDWFRVLKVGGFIVCMVPSQALYEKRRFMPSSFQSDHKRMYTPASLTATFEQALEVNTFRVRHMAENDRGFDYSLGPDTHSGGCYEIEIVIEKITPPSWHLA